MKLIVTGCTGFIGGGVLDSCLEDARVSSVIALSRRPLPDGITKNAKLKVIILTDFLSYSDEVLKELKGADGCIWALGGSTSNLGNYTIEVDFPMAFAAAYSKVIAAETGENKKPFRFLYVGGKFAEEDQNRSLFFLNQGRKAKGHGITRTLEFESSPENPAGKHASGTGQWESFSVRPGYVSPKGGNLLGSLAGTSFAIPVDILARGAIDIVLDRTGNWPKEKVTGNLELIEHVERIRKYNEGMARSFNEGPGTD